MFQCAVWRLVFQWSFTSAVLLALKLAWTVCSSFNCLGKTLFFKSWDLWNSHCQYQSVIVSVNVKQAMNKCLLVKTCKCLSLTRHIEDRHSARLLLFKAAYLPGLFENVTVIWCDIIICTLLGRRWNNNKINSSFDLCFSGQQDRKSKTVIFTKFSWTKRTKLAFPPSSSCWSGPSSTVTWSLPRWIYSIWFHLLYLTYLIFYIYSFIMHIEEIYFFVW